MNAKKTNGKNEKKNCIKLLLAEELLEQKAELVSCAEPELGLRDNPEQEEHKQVAQLEVGYMLAVRTPSVPVQVE